jgi:hypothetical protein
MAKIHWHCNEQSWRLSGNFIDFVAQQWLDRYGLALIPHWYDSDSVLRFQTLGSILFGLGGSTFGCSTLSEASYYILLFSAWLGTMLVHSTLLLSATWSWVHHFQMHAWIDLIRIGMIPLHPIIILIVISLCISFATLVCNSLSACFVGSFLYVLLLFVVSL